LAHYLRELILLLRSAGIGLDYPMLAADLYQYQSPDLASRVRLRWGQDFYRKTEEPRKD
jgi:CRISPR system Cascade subunit CasB